MSGANQFIQLSVFDRLEVSPKYGLRMLTITLHFGKVQWSYTRQKRSGGIAAGNTAAGWDCQRNCKV